MLKFFIFRELKESYIGNLTGLAWVFIQPVITLFVYAVVFEKIFKTRFPEAENVGFLTYLAVGFWPWIAFSEALLKSITSIVSQKNLIGKVKIELRQIVIATVTASFIIHITGYIFVLLILKLLGKEYMFSNFPLLIIPIMQLYFLAIAFGLLLSSFQVFIRDTFHLMSSLITLWFFSTPIIYSISLIPDRILMYVKINPVFTPINFIHQVLITNQDPYWLDMLKLTLFIVVFLYIANAVFIKLEKNFEDFI